MICFDFPNWLPYKHSLIERWIQQYPEAFSLELQLDETTLFFTMLRFPLVGDQKNKTPKDDQ